MESFLGLAAVFILVFINGFFVAAEFALVGARRTRIHQLANEGHGGARAAEQALDHLDSYIAATQLGITLASLGLGWIGEPAVAHLLEPLLDWIVPGEISKAALHSATIALGFSIVTTLHIVLGELAPKSIALQRPEGTSVVVARPTRLFLRVFNPVITVMNAIGNSVVRLLGFEPVSGHERVHSAEELVMLVASAHEAGMLYDSEELLLQRAFDFRDIHLRDVMQPRVEVEALPLDMALQEIVEKVSSGAYSRYPVYDEKIDKVVGILHARDLLAQVVRQPALLGEEASDFELKPVLRDPLFFPEMATVDKVLDQMQREQIHFTIVIDEFGGMAGIATMEDILEELIGEVQDEFDEEDAPVSVEADAVSLDGLITMHDIAERFGPLPEGEESHSATIGGYIAEQLDRIPSKSDTVRYAGYDVVVEEMDELRVARVKFVQRTTPPASLDTPAESASQNGT